MVTSVYDIGDLCELKATFKDISDVLTDPTAIDLVIREPDGVLVAKVIGDLTTAATGIFTYEFTFTKSGRHVVNWTATAGIVTAEETEFYVRKKGAV